MKINLTNIHEAVVVSPTMKNIILIIVAALVVAGLIAIQLERESQIEQNSARIAERSLVEKMNKQNQSERGAIKDGHAVEARP